MSSNKIKIKKKTPKPKKPRVRPQKEAVTVNVPEPTMLYGNSLCSPEKFTGAGVPIWPSLPTLKTNAFSRGIFTVGSQEVGFVYCPPENLGVNDAGASGLRYSQAAFAGTQFSSTTATGVSFAASNAQFASTAMGNSSNLARWRLVSACLRARYVGTELNRGGSIIAFAHPEHLSITGYDAPACLAFNSAKKVPVTREWTTVVYCPINVFWRTSITVDGSGADVGDMFMGILVEGGGSTSNNFEFEFFGNYEYEGPNIRGKTRCINDTTGMTSIQAAMQSINPVHSGNNDAPFRQTMWDRFKEYTLKAVTWVGKELRDVAVKGVPLLAEASLGALAAL